MVDYLQIFQETAVKQMYKSAILNPLLNVKVKTMDNIQVDTTVVNKPAKFHFKKDELGNKRPTVELSLPVPTAQGLVDILTRASAQVTPGDEAAQKAKDEATKELNLVLSLMEDAVIAQAREQVNSDVTIDQAKLKTAELSWNFIANIPPSDRRGGGISKETWEAFTKDYLQVVPGLTGKDATQVGNAAKLLVGKFQECKFKKNIVEFLQTQLRTWYANTPNAEEFTDVFEFLDKKATAIIAGHTEDLTANL